MSTNPYRYDLDRAVSEELRIEILRARMQMNEVSASTGIPATTLSRKVNGHSALTVGELGAITTTLGVPASGLVARAEHAALADSTDSSSSGVTVGGVLPEGQGASTPDEEALTDAGPTDEALGAHEAVCDSCWSLEDARRHLCGDEDPVSHRSSDEEVA